MKHGLAAQIAAGNELALRRLSAASPVLMGVRRAREVIPPLTGQALLHAGPPVAPDQMCGPMRGAVFGALLYETWCASPEDGALTLDGGRIELHCTHDWGAVGPMAGIISPSMPLLEVRDNAHGAVAYTPLNEGVGRVLRFGAYDPPVIAHLRWLGDVLAPALDGALRRLGGVPLVPLMARALAMGDEMHQRNVAASSLLFRLLVPALAEATPPEHLPAILRFLAGNDQFFLNVAMAAAKATMQGLGDVPYSTVVTAMSRNGVEFGLRVAGLGSQWVTAPAPRPVGLYFPGHAAEDANPDMGDSAILETIGLGAFAMAAAPAAAGFVGLGSVHDALTATQAMREITIGESSHFKIPALDGKGVPVGIDIRRVVKLQIEPMINTGIAHHRPGVGQIGAGIARAPLQAFQGALETFVARYANQAADP